MSVRPPRGDLRCGKCKMPPGAHGVESLRIWKRYGPLVGYWAAQDGAHPFRFAGVSKDAA